MFPIRDTIRSHTFPIVNWLIIAANAIVFFFELTLTPATLERLFYTFGMTPANVNPLFPVTFIPFFTHMFLHGGWLHFLSNMWTLYIFGDNVEDRMGSGRFLFFYLFGGLAAGGLQYLVAPNSLVPAIGASGAIAAVLGAYLLFYPRAQVITLIPVFIFPWFVNIPALIYIGFWFVTQLFSGVLALSTASGAAAGGVAWWAHVGGFLFGLLMAYPFAGFRRTAPRSYPDEYYPW
jgi:membrane associated rhomboid family serine protease